MIKRLINTIIFLFILTSILSAAKPTIAVPLFESPDISITDLEALTDLFTTALQNTRLVTIVERRRIDAIFEEQKINLSGISTVDGAIDVGNILSSEQLYLGSIRKLGETYYLIVNIVDTSTGEVIKSEKEEGATRWSLIPRFSDIVLRLTEDTGRLIINSNTNGKLYVDNINKDLLIESHKTLTISLSVGQHTLYLDYGGELETRRIYIQKDGTHKLLFTDRYDCSIDITSVTNGRLYLNGKFVSNVSPGNPVSRGINPGIQNVEIRYNTGHRESKEIKVSINQKKSVSFFWSESPSLVKPVMEKIRGGKFIMGSPDKPNRPVRKVLVSNSFSISKYEVSYREVVDVYNWALLNNKVKISYGYVKNKEGMEKELLDLNGLSSILSYSNNRLEVEYGMENYPCSEITWYGAVAFSNYLNEQNNISPVYNLSSWTWNKNISGYRLPTEAEWEFAAIGGNSSHGYIYSGSNNSNSVAWFKDNSRDRVYSVGNKYGNELDVYDMSGNLSEWVWDWYIAEYPGNSSYSVPSEPLDGNYRVRKGGSWNDIASSIENTARSYTRPNHSSRYVGFRIVNTN